MGPFLAAFAITRAHARTDAPRRALGAAIVALFATAAVTIAAINTQTFGLTGPAPGIALYLSLGTHGRLVLLGTLAAAVTLLIAPRPAHPLFTGTAWFLHSCDAIWLCVLAVYVLGL